MKENKKSQIRTTNSTDIDKKSRKKEGIFYTPDYITEYICASTIYLYLSKSHSDRMTVDQLIEEYKDNDDMRSLDAKVTQIKILDLACGTGAFLLKAFDILLDIKEHIRAFQAYMTPPDRSQRNKAHESYEAQQAQLKREIFQNNIFGVDISTEAIENTRSAILTKVGREKSEFLNTLDLSQTIQCGDALFEDPKIAGVHAFNWKEHFPSIMEHGGFDLIIGNPPYVDIKQLDPAKVKALFKSYTTAKNRINLYAVFIERAIRDLLKPFGLLGFIVPNSLLYNSSYADLRKFLIDHTTMDTIVRLPDIVFDQAKVESLIIILQRIHFDVPPSCQVMIYRGSNPITSIDPEQCMAVRRVEQKHWIHSKLYRFHLYDENTRRLLDKIEQDTIPLYDISDTGHPICNVSLGITPYDKYKGHTAAQIKGKVFHSDKKIDDMWKPLLSGDEIVRYGVFWNGNQYLKYGDWLGAPRERRFFMSPRILVRQIVSGNPPRIYAGYTEEELYNTQIAFNLILNGNSDFKLKYILAILNSKLMSFYHKEKFLDETKTLFQKILIENAKQFPIKKVSLEKQSEIESLVNKLIYITLETMKKKNDSDLLKKYQELNGELDREIFNLYKLNTEEKELINRVFIS